MPCGKIDKKTWDLEPSGASFQSMFRFPPLVDQTSGVDMEKTESYHCDGRPQACICYVIFVDLPLLTNWLQSIQSPKDAQGDSQSK